METCNLESKHHVFKDGATSCACGSYVVAASERGMVRATPTAFALPFVLRCPPWPVDVEVEA